MSSKTTAAKKPASKPAAKARAATSATGKSTARGGTTAKAAAPRKRAAAAKKIPARKAAPAAAEPALKPVPGSSSAPAAQDAPGITPVQVIRRKEMVERIVARSGLKANVVKSVLDPLLREMGEALSRGEVLTLQPLGKLMVNRRKEVSRGEVLFCKLRRTASAKNAPQPLAKPAE